LAAFPTAGTTLGYSGLGYDINNDGYISIDDIKTFFSTITSGGQTMPMYEAWLRDMLGSVQMTPSNPQDATNTVFTVNGSFSGKTYAVFVNGLKVRSSDYDETESNGVSTITFHSVPAGQTVEIAEYDPATGITPNNIAVQKFMSV